MTLILMLLRESADNESKKTIVDERYATELLLLLLQKQSSLVIVYAVLMGYQSLCHFNVFLLDFLLKIAEENRIWCIIATRSINTWS